MSTIYIRGQVMRASKDRGKAGDPIRFVAATEGIKEDGLNLLMDNLELARFEDNPVIGYGHSYFGRNNLPIGRATDIKIKAPALKLSVNFDQSDEFATTVEQKVRDGYMNAMSVGFDVSDVNPTTGVPASWELFEASIVPIPLDPDALAEVGRAAVKDLEGMLERAREAFATVAPAGEDDDSDDDDAGRTPRLEVAKRRLRVTS